MDAYPITAGEPHYTQQRQPQWPPHMLSPLPSASPFPSPPTSSIGAEHSQHYSPYYSSSSPQSQAVQPPSAPGQAGQTVANGTGSAPNDQMSRTHHLNRTASSLSLNLSSLTMTSPTNLSPITGPPSAGGANSALSPVTPISPSANPFSQHHHHHGSVSHITSPFQYPNSDGQTTTNAVQNTPQNSYEPDSSVAGSSGPGYDPNRPLRIKTGGSRSSSASTSSASLPPSRKRSFTSNPPASSGSTSALLEESSYEDTASDTPMDVGFDDASDLRSYAGTSTPSAGGGGGSPVDGTSSGGEDALGSGGTSSGGVMGGVGGSMGMLGKPMATNNFVTKLYQMINDSKSAHFISWTELGTSFVVSNVGEFSRTILGSHFKHNNFSSFVRQLNMYGFHKINRTPRAQRTSTDAQTWEFSHHKFLRGRPDLLDEIKRKALEPDPSMKHRVELPGELAAQIGALRDENRRMWEQLSAERRKSEKLAGVVSRLWDVVGKGFPGSLAPFPADLLDPIESPNIYITSPTSSTSRYPPAPLTTNLHPSLHGLHSMNSPGSSPTTNDFPPSIHHPHHHHPGHTLSRQHSFHHINLRTESSPSSPREMNMELFEDVGPGDGDNAPTGRGSTKRQRISIADGDGSMNGIGAGLNGIQNGLATMTPSTGSAGTSPMIGGLTPPKKPSRARSDSAPLGYPLGGLSWSGTGRPRSGSGMAMQQPTQQLHAATRTLTVPTMGNLPRPGGNPMAGFSPIPSNAIPSSR